jgi:hypothetical protein
LIPVISHALEPLSRADPELAARVAKQLARKAWVPDPALLDGLVSETIWALGVEVSFGQAVAGGLAELLGEVAPECLDVFRRYVREAAHAGATQGRIMAESLPAVLQCGAASLLDGFLKAWHAMAQKGSHTLGEPLRALGRLLAAGDRSGAAAYLGPMRRAGISAAPCPGRRSGSPWSGGRGSYPSSAALSARTTVWPSPS